MHAIPVIDLDAEGDAGGNGDGLGGERKRPESCGKEKSRETRNFLNR
jgi:hypothetical protein